MVVITVKVYPSARKNKIVAEKDLFGVLIYKVYTTKAPENGEANKAVVALLAECFKVAKKKFKFSTA